jgi:signal transduction histidine kinase
VRDDGPGFPAGTAHEGIGLQNMRDRLGSVRGSVDILSEPGDGTLAAATAPIRRGR